MIEKDIQLTLKYFWEEDVLPLLKFLFWIYIIGHFIGHAV